MGTAVSVNIGPKLLAGGSSKAGWGEAPAGERVAANKIPLNTKLRKTNRDPMAVRVQIRIQSLKLILGLNKSQKNQWPLVAASTKF